MPTYEYRCENCGYEFEQFQSITARSLHKCPECGRNTLKRLLGTGAGVIFKGNGFYQTDYRSESYKKQQDKENQKSKSTANSKSKSESKTPKTETDKKSKTTENKK
ncbi:FmdB family zinc ribbon protein [Planctomycetota bacterium]